MISSFEGMQWTHIKTPAPVPLGEGLPIVSSKECWNQVKLEMGVLVAVTIVVI